jgi:hypothetical protein
MSDEFSDSFVDTAVVVVYTGLLLFLVFSLIDYYKMRPQAFRV